MKDLVQEKLGEGESEAKLAVDIPTNFTCRTFVVAKGVANGDSPLTLFRSYRCQEFRPGQFPIWEVARCTTATPPFFRPIFVNKPPPGYWYADDSIEHSNPSEIALCEAQRIWTDVEGLCLVSIGGAHLPKVTAIRGNSEVDLDRLSPGGFEQLWKFASKYMKTSTSCELVHEKMSRIPNFGSDHVALSYHRFNVVGMNEVGLLEPERNISIIPDLTAHYLDEEMTAHQMHQCIRDLLLQGQRWEGHNMYHDEITARYNINWEAPLGCGGFGKVLQVFLSFVITNWQGYRSTDFKGNELSLAANIKSFALKIIDSQHAEGELAAIQSIASSRLSNADVIFVDDFWFENNQRQGISRTYIKMEQCQGTLQEYLGQLNLAGKSIDIQELVEIICHILSGLCHCHTRRVCHRDLKPSNSTTCTYLKTVNK